MVHWMFIKCSKEYEIYVCKPFFSHGMQKEAPVEVPFVSDKNR